MEQIRIWIWIGIWMGIRIGISNGGKPRPGTARPLRGSRNPEPGFTSASPARRTAAPRRAPIPPRHAPFYRTGFRPRRGGCRRGTRPTRATDGNQSASVAPDAHSHVLAGETRAKGAAPPWAAMCAACRVLGRTPVAPRRRHARPACRATLRHPTFRAPVRRSGCSQPSRSDHLPRTDVASASNQRKTSRSISLSEACALRARSSSSRTSTRSTSAPFSPSASRSNTLEVQCLTSSA